MAVRVGVVKTAVPLRNWVAVTSGYDVEHLFLRYCDLSMGRNRTYYYCAQQGLRRSLPAHGRPSCSIDVPQSDRGGPFVNFMKLGDALMRRGESKVFLGIAQAGRVQVHVYDVAGRKVRLLADRVFPAGEQTLVWDGTDDGGRKVARGCTSCAAARRRTRGGSWC
jgi:hypothetical protein